MSDQKLLIGYYRLSREDDNAGDSNSIINQRKLVKDYISHMSDLEEMSFQEFYDDGYSGSSMDRPGIKKVAVNGVNSNFILDYRCQTMKFT